MTEQRPTFRRTRIHPALREMLASVKVMPENLMLPLFIVPGKGVKEPVASMPGVFRLSADQAAEYLAPLVDQGLRAVMLFGVVPASDKDTTGSHALKADSVVASALKLFKARYPGVLFAVDLCFCEYTDHGHCGVLDQSTGRTDVNNDATLELLAKQVVSHAQAGADIVAPSGMMDGMIGAIRFALDDAGFSHLPVMAYSAKYAGGFYGPFREAAESTPQSGDRRSYQMDSASDPGQALREVALDVAEGADIVMVKPALAYLDIIAAVHRQFPGVPVAAYNVSGEYSLVKAAAAKGWIDERTVATEIITGIVRAGASIVITYWAKDLARWLK